MLQGAALTFSLERLWKCQMLNGIRSKPSGMFAPSLLKGGCGFSGDFKGLFARPTVYMWANIQHADLYIIITFTLGF